MELIFEKSKPGRKGYSLPKLDVPKKEKLIPKELLRDSIELPEISEVDIVRHHLVQNIVQAYKKKTEGKS